ncbi:MAG: hypothetical protein U1F65_02690 [Verrucomicrobiota bacterium]
MANNPRHEHNPCSFSENEQTPAKIWELLRRNEKFQRAVAKLQRIDAAAKAELIIGDAWFSADRLVKTLKEHHEFAGHALQWLVPEPLFRISKVAIPRDIDLSGKSWIALDTITQGESTTPDIKDRERWAWRRLKPKQPRAGGNMMRRGPTIEWQTSGNLQFHNKVNPIAQWREYQESQGLFKVTHPWKSAPPQFKSVFCWLWRQRDSRAKDSVTGHRFDAPNAHETDFFQGWNLLSALAKNSIEQQALERAITFDELARHYRVFAIPNSIRTRMEARQVARWFFDQIADGLPQREPELFGSPLQWDILLTVEDLMRDGAPFDEALQESFEILHLKADKWHEGQPVPDQKKGWARRGADWQKTYRIMDAPLTGTGFVQKIFPGRPSPPASAMSV